MKQLSLAIFLTIFLTFLTIALCQSQVNEEAVLSWEIGQFVGKSNHDFYRIESAELISEGVNHTISVRTAEDSLTFTMSKSIMYSDITHAPLVVHSDRRSILILPKR